MTDAALIASDRLFSTRFMWVKLLAALYVVAIPISHGVLPSAWVWDIALAFLLLMLPPYVIAAVRSRHAVRLELTVAAALAAIALTGYLASAPPLIILAIAGHGVWDFAKQRGAGARFFGWYVSGCMIVDWTYAAALCLHYLVVGYP